MIVQRPHWPGGSEPGCKQKKAPRPGWGTVGLGIGAWGPWCSRAVGLAGEGFGLVGDAFEVFDQHAQEVEVLAAWGAFDFGIDVEAL
jgi:hypothetical protein